MGLLRSTYGDGALPFGMFGVGDALVGAGIPFARAAIGWSALSEHLMNCLHFPGHFFGRRIGRIKEDRSTSRLVIDKQGAC